MVKHGMQDGVNDLIGQALSKMLADSDAHLEAGVQCYEGGDYAGAARHLEAISVKDMGKENTSRSILGYCNLKIGDVGKAERHIRAAMKAAKHPPLFGKKGKPEREPQLALLFALKHGFETQDSEPDSAAAAYQIVRKLGDSDLAARAALNLGYIEINRNRLAAAKELFEEVLDNGRRKDKALASFNMGWYSELQGNRREAWKWYKIAARKATWCRERRVLNEAKYRLTELARGRR